jgi:hypothetical protein
MKYQPAGNTNPNRQLRTIVPCYIETGMAHGTKAPESIMMIMMMRIISIV